MKNYFSSEKLPVINFILILVIIVIGLPVVFFFARYGRLSSGSGGSSGEESGGVLGSGLSAGYAAGGNLEELRNSYREIARAVLPQVVQLNVTEIIRGQSASPYGFLFDNLPPPGSENIQQGLGSGVIVRKNGRTVYVLTNNHVVGNAEEISVTLYDGRRFNGKLVGSDEYKDLALVAFTAGGDIPVAELGDSTALVPGDIVLAVGNPLGFSSTITAGIVSAVGRSADIGTDVTSFTDYIQTDAAINQGNSGGALVDISGRVVGINSWIASSTGGNIGIGFAIPINNAKKSIDDFIRTGRVEYGWLGINSSDPPETVVKEMRLGNGEGTFVVDIFRDSPAEEAGIRPGDFITALDGKPVKNSNSIILILSELSPGTTVPVRVMRLGRSFSVNLKIGLRPSRENVSGVRGNVWPGFSVVPATGALQNQLGLSGGGSIIVVNVEIGSPGQLGGLAAGDAVLAVDGERVDEMADFYRLINRSLGEPKTVTIERNGTRVNVTLDW